METAVLILAVAGLVMSCNPCDKLKQFQLSTDINKGLNFQENFYLNNPIIGLVKLVAKQYCFASPGKAAKQKKTRGEVDVFIDLKDPTVTLTNY